MDGGHSRNLVRKPFRRKDGLEGPVHGPSRPENYISTRPPPAPADRQGRGEQPPQPPLLPHLGTIGRSGARLSVIGTISPWPCCTVRISPPANSTSSPP